MSFPLKRRLSVTCTNLNLTQCYLRYNCHIVICNVTCINQVILPQCNQSLPYQIQLFPLVISIGVTLNCTSNGFNHVISVFSVQNGYQPQPNPAFNFITKKKSLSNPI